MSYAEDLIRQAVGSTCCGQCAGVGVIIDRVDEVAPGLVFVTWLTVHKGGCPGADYEERSYLLDVAAIDAGDVLLPGLPASSDYPAGEQR